MKFASLAILRELVRLPDSFQALHQQLQRQMDMLSVQIGTSCSAQGAMRRSMVSLRYSAVRSAILGLSLMRANVACGHPGKIMQKLQRNQQVQQSEASGQ